MTTRAALLALALGTSALTSAHAQNFEYDNPNWFDGSSSQPNLAQINVTPGLHFDFKAYIDSVATDTSVIVAVLDGLTDFTHVDLEGQGSTLIVYGGRYRRYSNHGTHVSGIIGAKRNDIGIVGVSPFTTLLNIPVFDGKKWLAKDLGLAAFSAAAAAGARVVNMSYGPASVDGLGLIPNKGPPPGKGPGGGGGEEETTTRANLFFNGELDLFKNYNMVFVRAAGNDGIDIGNEPFVGDASTLLSNLLIVGSVDGNNVISSFSNTPGDACIGGETTALCTSSNANAMMNFFLVAPGESIISDLPNNYVGIMSGTSMAAPHVSGAAALVFQAALAGDTNLTAGAVAGILKLSAQDLGAAGVDDVYGWGLLDVVAALGNPQGGTFLPLGGTVESSVSLQSTNISMSSTVGSGAVVEALSGLMILDQFERAFVVESPELETTSSPFASNIVQQLSAAVSSFQMIFTDDGHTMVSLISQSDLAHGGFSAMSFDNGDWRFDAALGGSPSYFTMLGATRQVNRPSVSRNMAEEFFTGSGGAGAALDKSVFFGADLKADSRLTLSGLYIRTAPKGLYVPDDITSAFLYQDTESSLVKFGGSYQLWNDVSLGASYGLLAEQNQTLGMQTAGTFGLGDSTTHITGASLRTDVTPTTSVAAFAEQSITTSSGSRNSIFGNVENWKGSKFGISLTESDVLSLGDVLRVKLVRPWQVDHGTLGVHLPVGRELDGTVNYEDRVVSFGADSMPWEVGLEYLGGGEALKYGIALTALDRQTTGRNAPEVSFAAALYWSF